MIELSEVDIISMQISSGLSMLASLLVMITIYKIDGYDKVFLKSVFFISFSDFFASLGTVIGGTKSDSAACYFQGIVSNYFDLTSFFWTFMTAYQVYLIVFKNRTDKDMKLQWFGWILPIGFTLLPLTTSTYANDDGTTGWCYISANAPSGESWLPLFWFLFSFFFWLWLLFFFIIFIIIAVGYKLWYKQLNVAAKPVVLRLIGYPIILFVSWVVPSVIDIDTAVGGKMNQSNLPFTVTTAFILPTIQGLLNAIYFFGVNDHYFIALISPKKDSSIKLLVRDTIYHSDYNGSEDAINSSLHASIVSLSNLNIENSIISESNESGKPSSDASLYAKNSTGSFFSQYSYNSNTSSLDAASQARESAMRSDSSGANSSQGHQRAVELSLSRQNAPPIAGAFTDGSSANSASYTDSSSIP